MDVTAIIFLVIVYTVHALSSTKRKRGQNRLLNRTEPRKRYRLVANPGYAQQPTASCRRA